MSLETGQPNTINYKILEYNGQSIACKSLTSFYLSLTLKRN